MLSDPLAMLAAVFLIGMLTGAVVALLLVSWLAAATRDDQLAGRPRP